MACFSTSTKATKRTTVKKCNQGVDDYFRYTSIINYKSPVIAGYFSDYTHTMYLIK